MVGFVPEGATTEIVEPKRKPYPRLLTDAERYSDCVRLARGPAKQRLIRDRAYVRVRSRRRALNA
jgi:hypothetical protein